MLATPSSERHFAMYEALKKGATSEEIHNITHVKKWFIDQMKELAEDKDPPVDLQRANVAGVTNLRCLILVLVVDLIEQNGGIVRRQAGNICLIQRIGDLAEVV